MVGIQTLAGVMAKPLIVGMYFYTNDWIYSTGLIVVMALVTHLWVVTGPETPRYLYAKKRYDDLRGVFSWIARFNRRP